eukprot:310858-Hanusia_phi.AAC.1
MMYDASPGYVTQGGGVRPGRPGSDLVGPGGRDRTLRKGGWGTLSFRIMRWVAQRLFEQT